LNDANLISANLIGVNLSGANLSYANLRYANLSYANLSGANLSYANLGYTNLSGANINKAEFKDNSGLTEDIELYLDVADLGYNFYLLVIAKLLNGDYSRLFNFYFHTLIQQHFYLKQRRAIFENSPGDRSEALSRR